MWSAREANLEGGRAVKLGIKIPRSLPLTGAQVASHRPQQTRECSLRIASYSTNQTDSHTDSVRRLPYFRKLLLATYDTWSLRGTEVEDGGMSLVDSVLSTSLTEARCSLLPLFPWQSSFRTMLQPASVRSTTVELITKKMRCELKGNGLSR